MSDVRLIISFFPSFQVNMPIYTKRFTGYLRVNAYVFSLVTEIF